MTVAEAAYQEALWERSGRPEQSSLFDDAPLPPIEDMDFLTRQLVTYIGNKRSLATHLERAIAKVRAELGGRALTAVDLFSGSGLVARVMKRHTSLIVANDLERYSEVVNTCYLSNRSETDLRLVRQWVEELNAEAAAGANPGGFVQRLYAPADDRRIRPGERVFYTTDNARRLDFYAQAITEAPAHIQPLLHGPLLSSASVHANTSGVFKGFYKDKNTGVGKFGAAKGDALARILAPITLDVPVLSLHSTRSRVFRQDANDLVRSLGHVDVAYIDPPYNQHPYGSNYFMLNLLVEYQEPGETSDVSGIPVGWNRSRYNVRKDSLPQMRDLVAGVDASYLLVSFNAEGFIPIGDLRATLESFGGVEEVVIPYNTFRGSRNLRDRNIHVNEHLFLVRRKGG
ncbi:MAG: DNA adenine methylase [Propionibacteriaceae bacterium]|jgi:adenine-specific DNA-methyltransferase|nr:DNA adenine methylase [Propionibacteriaceae bacterium]